MKPHKDNKILLKKKNRRIMSETGGKKKEEEKTKSDLNARLKITCSISKRLV